MSLTRPENVYKRFMRTKVFNVQSESVVEIVEILEENGLEEV